MIDPISSKVTRTTSKEMDRPSAALEQLENAISCFFRNEWASSITLALAVEGMLPPCPDDIDIIAKSKRFFLDRGHTEKEGIDCLNQHRNWLKHSLVEKKKLFTELDTVFAILRALSRVQYCTGRVSNKTAEFVVWLEHSKHEITNNTDQIFESGAR